MSVGLGSVMLFAWATSLTVVVWRQDPLLLVCPESGLAHAPAYGLPAISRDTYFAAYQKDHAPIRVPVDPDEAVWGFWNGFWFGICVAIDLAATVAILAACHRQRKACYKSRQSQQDVLQLADLAAEANRHQAVCKPELLQVMDVQAKVETVLTETYVSAETDIPRHALKTVRQLEKSDMRNLETEKLLSDDCSDDTDSTILPLPPTRLSSMTELGTLTPREGAAWDWPLSRNEKKALLDAIELHIHKIDQGELIRELGEMHALWNNRLPDTASYEHTML